MNHPIFILTQSLRPGGAERVLARLARDFAQEFPVYLCVVRNEGILAAEIPSNVRLIDLGGPITWLPTLLRMIWRHRPSALLSSAWDLSLMLLVTRVMLPKATRLIIREAVDPCDAGREKPSRKLLAPLYLRLLRNADAIVVLTHELAERLVSGSHLPHENVHVIHNTPALSRCGDPAARVRPSPPHPPYRLLAVGRLCHQKGFDVLIEALKRLDATGVSATLTIAGDGPESKHLEQLAAQLGIGNKINFAGHVQDLRNLYTESDLYVLSSRYEGMSNALIEALCSGLPVLATTENTSAAEFVSAGVNGFLVPGCDPEHLLTGLTTALKGLSALDRANIAENSRARFSSDTSYRAYRRLFSPTK